jgi:hypothetical protein
MRRVLDQRPAEVSATWPLTYLANTPARSPERGEAAAGQLTVSADAVPAADITARPGAILRSARLPRDSLPGPKLVAPAGNVYAFPLL